MQGRGRRADHATSERGTALAGGCRADGREELLRTPAATARYRIPVLRVSLVRERTITASARAIGKPQDAAEVLREAIGDYDREAFAVLLLDAKYKVIGVHIASIGTLNSAPIGPRETFRAAIMAGAAAIIVGHNHPSGDPEPSAADLTVTKHLDRAGALLGVPVLDCVIVGNGGGYISLKERGVLAASP